MPLIVDATALIALGEIGEISLLEHVGQDVIVSSGIRDQEARRFHRQIDEGVAAGRIQIGIPHAPTVAVLRGMTGSFEMGRGEAESIAIAYALGNAPVSLLLDEGDTFKWVTEGLARPESGRNWRTMCLAELLHDLETNRRIPSASNLMQQLLDNDYYAWAPIVRRHYETWCANNGLVPVPR